MFNLRPYDFWPWLNIQPSKDDAPGFHLTPDDAMQNGFAFADPASAATSSMGPRIGFSTENRLPSGNPVDFFDWLDFSLRPPTPLGTSPMHPSISGMPYLDPGLQRYLDNLRGTLDTSPPPGDARFPFGAGASAWPAFPDNFNRGTFGYDRPEDTQSFTNPLMRSAGIENRPSFALYDPTFPAAPPPNPVQEAFDQLSQIYARIGLDPLNRFNGQDQRIGPAVLRADEVSPAVGDAFDPQYVVPTQSGPNRPLPPPGPGHNNPSKSPAPLDPRPGTVAPLPPRPTPAEQPPPSPAAAAAAAEAALRRRENEYNTYREHLQQLDTDHPLLKLGPVPGVVPDQTTVDRYGDAVKEIVRKRAEQTVADLSARSTYDNRSIVKTIRGDADLRAEFDRLKVTGTRISGGLGQYGRDGELYALPGGVRIGFRMANDDRTGEKRSVPTLDIMIPGRKPIRFHYNNQR